MFYFKKLITGWIIIYLDLPCVIKNFSFLWWLCVCLFVWGLLMVKLWVKFYLFVLRCRGRQRFICFIVLLCSVGGVVPTKFVFVVVDPCCCLTRNMNACFVVVVVVPILGFIFVMFWKALLVMLFLLIFWGRLHGSTSAIMFYPVPYFYPNH